MRYTIRITPPRRLKPMSPSLQHYVIMVAFSENLCEVVCLTKNRGPKEIVGKVNFPGGRLELFDPDPQEAAIRELKEETGVVVPPARMTRVSCTESPRSRIEVYVARGDIFGARTTEDEVVFIADVEAILDSARSPATADLYAPDFVEILQSAMDKAALIPCPAPSPAATLGVKPPVPPVRLDQWCAVYQSPNAVPGELAPRGGVFRGMRSLEAAKAYADQVTQFFHANDANQRAFVVAGPTSTTKEPFEVVEATCGYTVLYRAEDPALAAETAAPARRARS